MFNEDYRHQADLVLTVLGYMNWEGCFAMKGGTALNFFYENLPRLSIDIDLVYLPLRSREDSLNEMRRMLDQYAIEFTKRGLRAEVRGVKKENPVGRLYVSNNLADIKIEPNLVIRGTIEQTKIKYLSPAAKETFQQDLKEGVRCLDHKEIMGGKLVAMLDRQHPRDVFDLLNYYEQKRHLKTFMDHFVVYLSQGNRSFIEALVPNFQNMENLFNTDFIGMTQKPVDLKNLVECRKEVLDDLHRNLESRHREFMISFMQGQPRWELMPFKHLDQLPGIKWRLQNLQAISDIKREEEITKLRNLRILSR